MFEDYSFCGDPDYVGYVWNELLKSIGWSRKRRKKWLRRQGYQLHPMDIDL